MTESPLFIVDGTSGQLVEAMLCQPISEQHLGDTETEWHPWLQAAYVKNPSLPREESGHWDWRVKMQDYGGQLGFPSFAVVCDEQTQGLMILNNLASCRLESQQGKSLVYVEYLATAPWNRALLAGAPRYRAIGSILMGIAIRQSIDDGFSGRLGLHSLPQADRWYRERCKMTDLGQDVTKQNLRYFEMTAEQSQIFLKNS